MKALKRVSQPRYIIFNFVVAVANFRLRNNSQIHVTNIRFLLYTFFFKRNSRKLNSDYIEWKSHYVGSCMK